MEKSKKGEEKMKTVEERFWEKVDKRTESDCWIWTGSKNRKEYGQFNIDGKTFTTHRTSWKMKNGTIPEGLHVLHKCDNPSCIRPDHLFLGTNADNMADMVKKGRQAKGKKSGMFGRTGENHPMFGMTGKKNGMFGKGHIIQGERNGNVKLNETAVRIIRTLHRDFEFKQIELANLYSVSRSLVSAIINQKIWKHI